MLYYPLRTERYFRDNPEIAARTASNLKDLREWIPNGGKVPRKDLGKTLLLATWNIRDFGRSGGRGYGERTSDSPMYIAEVISAFDLVAVQEVNADMELFRRVVWLLGKSWDFIVTDVTEGASGNGERMAYVFDRRKVSFRGIAGEITLKPDDLVKGGKLSELPVPDGSTIIAANGTQTPVTEGSKLTFPEDQKLITGRQFARTPFLISFQAGWFKFNLCTVHLLFGSGSEGLELRKEEIQKVGEFFANRNKRVIKRKRKEAYDAFERANGRKANNSERRDIRNKVDPKHAETYILLGDFNIVGPDDETFSALTASGFRVPQELSGNPTNMLGTKHYDQIAFLPKSGPFKISHSQAGVLKLFDVIYRASSDDWNFVDTPGGALPDDDFSDFSVYYPLVKAEHYEGINASLAKTHDKKRNLKRDGTTVKTVVKGDPRNIGDKRLWYASEWRTYHLSDHLPLWVALDIDFTTGYLNDTIKQSEEEGCSG
jgi:hypothetical protein